MVINKEYVTKRQHLRGLEQSTWLKNRKIDTKVQKSLSLLNAVLESAADGIIALGYQGEIFSFNQKLLEIWKIPNSFALLENRDCYLSFCKNQIQDGEKIDKLIQELDRPSDAEESDFWQLKDGRIIERYSKPLIVGEENLGRVWSFRASKDTQKAEELDQQLHKEKELNEQRAKFVSMVSHEFRIPLNIISFAASLLKRHGDRWNKEKKNEYFDRLQSAVEQLSLLMDEVLLIGRAEAGKLAFEPKTINLANLCQEIISEIHLKEKTQEWINFIDRSKDKKVSIDKKILRRILINLLSNAIKYSPSGNKVDLIISIVNNKTILQVKDKGIGIPLVDRQKLFEPFYRASNVGDSPGHGLGLAIVKKLVDIHSGQITLESEVGRGTTITISL